MQLPDPNLRWAIPMPAVALIAEFEQGPRGGVALATYTCPAGIPTIGWGETDPDKAKPGSTCTKEQADQWLCDDIALRTMQVKAMLADTYATPNQLGALVSLAYNIGLGALSTSTVLRCHKRGDFEGAARAFSLWNKARVKGVLTALNGLTRRRKAEAALYLTPEPSEGVERMPQAVEAESSLSKSPIAQSGAATAGAGVLALAPLVGEQVAPVKAAVESVKSLTVDTLGVPADWFLPVLLLAAGAAAVYWRLKQRRQGWA